MQAYFDERKEEAFDKWHSNGVVVFDGRLFKEDENEE